jgi:site-specific DNA recombinase
MEITTRVADAFADVLDVHPNIANIYRTRVAAFSEVLNDTNGGQERAKVLLSLKK